MTTINLSVIKPYAATSAGDPRQGPDLEEAGGGVVPNHEDGKQILQARSMTFGDEARTFEEVTSIAKRYARGDIPRIALKKLKDEKAREYAASQERGRAKAAERGGSEEVPPKPAKVARKPAEAAEAPKGATATAENPPPVDVSSASGIFDGGVPTSFEQQWS